MKIVSFVDWAKESEIGLQGQWLVIKLPCLIGHPLISDAIDIIYPNSYP